MLNDTDGTLKLCDYTVSIFVHYLERLQVKKKGEGLKHLWLAPEINFEMKFDTRCDIWGIGCLTLELLTGKPPFYEQSNQGDYKRFMELLNLKGK